MVPKMQAAWITNQPVRELTPNLKRKRCDTLQHICTAAQRPLSILLSPNPWNRKVPGSSMKKAKLALEGIYNSGKPYPRAKGHKSNTNSLVKKYNQLFKKILTLTKPKRD